MQSEVRIIRQIGGITPHFEGEWNGRPVEIKFDSSAVMKLAGSGPLSNMNDNLDVPGGVARAARRLIEMRQMEQSGDHLTVVLSALDLD